jgi:hypothetical protein
MQRWLAGKTAVMWNAMDGPDTSRRCEAIVYWARRRVDLPGPVSFTLPTDKELGRNKAKVLRGSEASCECGTQRRYVPLGPRLFYPRIKPEIITLRVDEPILSITMWGGGIRETIVQVDCGQKYFWSTTTPNDPRAGISHISYVKLREQLLARKPHPLVVGTHLHVLTPDVPNPLRLETFAIHNVNPEQETVDVAISRCYKRADPDAAPAHVCS